jgi:hypothetical protein
MFGRIARTALLAIPAWIIAEVIQELGTVFLDVLKMLPESDQAPKVIGYLELAVNNILFVFLLSLLMVLIAGAVVERRVVGGGPV